MKKLLFFLLICVVFLNKGQTQENIEAPVEDTLTVVQAGFMRVWVSG